MLVVPAPTEWRGLPFPGLGGDPDDTYYIPFWGSLCYARPAPGRLVVVGLLGWARELNTVDPPPPAFSTTFDLWVFVVEENGAGSATVVHSQELVRENGDSIDSLSLSARPDGTLDLVGCGLLNGVGSRRVWHRISRDGGVTWNAWNELNFPAPVSLGLDLKHVHGVTHTVDHARNLLILFPQLVLQNGSGIVQGSWDCWVTGRLDWTEQQWLDNAAPQVIKKVGTSEGGGTITEAHVRRDKTVEILGTSSEVEIDDFTGSRDVLRWRNLQSTGAGSFVNGGTVGPHHLRANDPFTIGDTRAPAPRSFCHDYRQGRLWVAGWSNWGVNVFDAAEPVHPSTRRGWWVWGGRASGGGWDFSADPVHVFDNNGENAINEFFNTALNEWIPGSTWSNSAGQIRMHRDGIPELLYVDAVHNVRMIRARGGVSADWS